MGYNLDCHMGIPHGAHHGSQVPQVDWGWVSHLGPIWDPCGIPTWQSQWDTTGCPWTNPSRIPVVIPEGPYAVSQIGLTWGSYGCVGCVSWTDVGGANYCVVVSYIGTMSIGPAK